MLPPERPTMPSLQSSHKLLPPSPHSGTVGLLGHCNVGDGRLSVPGLAKEVLSSGEFNANSHSSLLRRVRGWYAGAAAVCMNLRL